MEPGMTEFTFKRYHYPTQTESYGTLECYTRLGFLETLNGWNAQMPGIWQYYEGQKRTYEKK